MPTLDRREYYRLPIRVPIFIKGIDKNGDEFFELTHTLDVSASGACLITRRELATSADLLVSIPAPVNSEVSLSDDHDFRFPSKIVRLDDGIANQSRKISVRFTKLLYENP